MKHHIHIILLSCILLFFSGCKSTKTVTNSGEVAKLSTKNIIKNHYNSETNFNTIRGKLKVRYNDGKTEESFSLSLRMEKDKAIWLSATLSLVKVYITPKRVQFYNKLDNTYFDGDFALISKFLGTDLDFEKVQNLLIANALFDLTSERYNSEIQGKSYVLTPRRDLELFQRLYMIDPYHFRTQQQLLTQSEKQRLLTVDYQEYQEITGQVFPKIINISAQEANKTTRIEIEYKKITFNEDVRFPFDIPDGYEEIKL